MMARNRELDTAVMLKHRPLLIPAPRVPSTNGTCGASNFSFGLPNRHGMNSAFLSMMIGAGLTSAITNPLHEPEMTGVMGANIVMGHDANCQAWIEKFRDPSLKGSRGSREGRRRRSSVSRV